MDRSSDSLDMDGKLSRLDAISCLESAMNTDVNRSVEFRHIQFQCAKRGLEKAISQGDKPALYLLAKQYLNSVFLDAIGEDTRTGIRKSVVLWCRSLDENLEYAIAYPLHDWEVCATGLRVQ